MSGTAAFDPFADEQTLAAAGEALLADGGDLAAGYPALLEGYRKLLGQSRRLVRMSDRNEEKLRSANGRIRRQQEELAQAHQLLAEHAERLEERVAERTRELVEAQRALERMVEDQRALFDAVVKLIAAAIDAKSPYTGGHCERVPEITNELARVACATREGPLADFDLDANGWRELELAGWLHDCGKVTTPEYVVDKATKLETIYNRIHEIRTRFEVMLRDCRIDYLKARLAGEWEPGVLERAYEARVAQLHDDFAFVAECNIGGEFMDEGRVARLEAIGERRWRRHFDDRLGLSEGERKRLEGVPAPALPVEERLLGDKPEHIIPRSAENPLAYAPGSHGFRIPVPESLYNLGELHNLRIPRGTLTAEERFKVNEHIIHTILMLDQLPFPAGIDGVGRIAGGHHETMIGSGYPRGLRREELPVQARILAIADIFEALTASDRPYKRPKSLSEALRIMASMRDGGHIDPDLFALFLTGGVYRHYAERYLSAEQIDFVEIDAYL
ncbi:HD-GYP domain-containing protein [Endothiovibrio diazotrophicus]